MRGSRRVLIAIAFAAAGALGAAGCGDNLEGPCGDTSFCNGIERIVDGKCIKVPANPCDDFEDCTMDVCHEDTKTCDHIPTGDGCAVCRQQNCTPDCAEKVCGDDGCGGSCGTCGAGMGCTPGGDCAAATGIGSCASPRPLAATLGTQLLTGDTTASVHQTTPTCNSTSTAVEEVWQFTITEPTGIEAQSFGYDTVLSLRAGATAAACLDDSPGTTIACSDDSAPPGDYGSRIFARLQPGTYYLIVDGFDASQFGPYSLRVKFAADCIPNCDGQYCGGDDGCGGTCGACAEGETCGPDLRCRPDPCIPDCQNDDGSARTCGDDGCGGSCGACAAGDACVPVTGTCKTFAACDHDRPTCAGGCPARSFCGSDCECHSIDDPLPDLVINEQRLADEILFDHVNVHESSCSYVEQCVGGLGDRRVLRFSVEAINQGQATLTVPPPEERPDLFLFSTCHGHYHFGGFAAYSLIDGQGRVVVTGRKQAYCMEDTIQVAQGPDVGCSKIYNCYNQGIQAGWSDLYGNTLDCQWLDITGVPSGNYRLQVSLNPNHAFQEVTFDNNTASVPVVIPP
ncbi:MAG TPA: lysyl oxidase family protein [Kofleriaceae bacterium]|nr:lysyl oxidase family protein [Kofleriaceae bacterium]